jgi:hypothetical protein
MYANARSVLDHPRADLDQALPYGCELGLGQRAAAESYRTVCNSRYKMRSTIADSITTSARSRCSLRKITPNIVPPGTRRAPESLAFGQNNCSPLIL